MEKSFAFLAGIFLAVVSVSAQHAFIPAASDWRYLDTGSDQGTSWQAPAFDDSTWATGLAPLGYGDGDEATVISFGPDPTSKYITTYFRRSFWVTNAAQVSNLVLRLLADDGAVAYINGVEVARQNMPAGPISYLTLAPAAAEDVWMDIPLSPSVLVNSQNSLAIEVHQANGASSDLSFDAALIGTTGPGPTPPTIVSQPQSQTAIVGSSVSFTVGVTGTEPLSYRWRRNGSTIAGSSNSPTYTIPSVQTNHAGVYSVLVSNIAGARISSNALLTVIGTPPTNLPPTVALVAPTNTATFPAGASIFLEATASDPDGTVTLVEFRANGTKVAEATSASGNFSSVWSNAPAGTFQLVAQAVDNAGARGASAPVQVVVGTSPPPGVTLISTGGVWRYLDNGSDQGTAWQVASFNDSTWASGLAQLGYGDGDEATVISFGPNATSKYITTYFRRLFGVTNAAQFTNLVLRLLADDGAVAYINGIEVCRVNMPAGPVSSLTTAAAAVEDVWMDIPVSSSVLINGPNILAVEVHQVNGASSDLSFDAALIGGTGGTGSTPPTIVSQPQSQTATVGSSVSFTVGATGTEPLFYRWRRNGANIPGATNSPTLIIPSVQTNHAGAYSVIVSNIAGSRISSNALLTVVPPPGTNLPPVVNLLTPTNGTSLPSGIPVILQAAASDPDGTVGRVEFFAGTNRIGIALSSTGTFSTVWSNAPLGRFLITAVAIDNSGARTTSAANEIFIGIDQEPSPVVLIPKGAVWRYLDDGSDQGSAWAAPGFNDSSWSTGAAQLGFGDSDEATLLRPGAITYYFRRTFIVPANATLQNITLHLLRDDGAVVYLNGVEISRQNMPAGPVTYQTFATVAVGGPEETTLFLTSPVPPELLVSGVNTIAVEIHQVNFASSDVSFDLQLTAASPAAIAPIIITHPGSQTVFEGSNVTFRVDAAGTEPLRYRWRRNGVFLDTGTNLAFTLLNGATNPTLTILNAPTNASGNYSVLVSNSGGNRLSSNAVLNVIPRNRPPLAFPQSFTILEDSSILITLASGDPDGGVLQYFVDNPTHGTITPWTVPFQVIYAPDPNYHGADSFTWRAFDGEFFSEFATVSITLLPVNDPPAARLVVENIVTFLGDLAVITLDGAVVLDGSQSTDVDNDPLQYLWSTGDPPEAFAAGVRVTNEFASGSHQIVLEVSDGTAIGADSVSLNVLLPCDAINLLIIRIEDASLRRQTKRALIRYLHMACDAFQHGRVDRSIDLLQNFQGKVAAQASEIDPVLADLLLGSTQTLIDALTPQ